MILQLQSDQVSAMWDAIKFAACGANGIKQDRAQIFLNNLLGNIMAGKVQVWCSFLDGPEGRDIHAFGITCVQREEVLGMDYLLMHSLYSYKALTIELMHEAMEAFINFARENSCFKFVAMTNDERLLKLYTHLGMKHEVYVWSKDI